jgi:heavy metal translocating P-type ATPase
MTAGSAHRRVARLWHHRTRIIAAFAALAIALHLTLYFGSSLPPPLVQLPLILTLLVGGGPLVGELTRKLIQRDFGSDLLAGISIVTSIILGEYLAGSIVVLMLSGGDVLENYAIRSASSVLAALSNRMPSFAHRRQAGTISDIALSDVAVGDQLIVFPHEICPVDGVVIEGHGVMDESYLTGEPFRITKTVGTEVISGAINGHTALTIRTTKRSEDSRYAKIMEVMRESEEKRPRLRRLGDQLGAVYTPIALTVAILAWVFSGEAIRFLAVLVIATPCPLLIAIPVAIIGSISLSARRAIIVKSPVVLEQIGECRIAIFDKTGTLTHGEPQLIDQWVTPAWQPNTVLQWVASLERYSKHPLARAILAEATRQNLDLPEASHVSEAPGKGLVGEVAGVRVQITSRKKLEDQEFLGAAEWPAAQEGLECLILIDGQPAAVYRFRDAPRAASRSFIKHLGPKHQFRRVLLVSGDRESEVRYLADKVGIQEVYFQQTPEQKLAIVRQASQEAKTLFVGDGVNDAPAMLAATVGMAIGQNSDVTTEAAGVVIMDSSLERVDEFLHISRRMRGIALQSAIGGMLLSMGGMAFAAAGYLTPVHGAIAQEVIDVLAVLNALRAAFPPRILHDL